MSGPRQRERPRGNIEARFNRIRVEAGLTQRQLAELSGVSERTIQNFEAGRNDMTLKMFIAALNALGYEVTLERRTTCTPS